MSKDAVPVEQQTERDRRGPLAGLQQVGRIADFWRRGSAVYLGYKGAQVQGRLRRLAHSCRGEARSLSNCSVQVRAAFLRKGRGWDAERLRTDFWAHHHTWAGQQFYDMAVDLRGFYLKVGQFMGPMHCH